MPNQTDSRLGYNGYFVAMSGCQSIIQNIAISVERGVLTETPTNVTGDPAIAEMYRASQPNPPIERIVRTDIVIAPD